MALTPELVTDGSFEPVTPLPTNNRGNQDKRSTRDAAWFTTNLPGWTFGPDNNGSGICNNGSYFTNKSQLLGGKSCCAFLRKVISNGKVSVGPGIVSQKVTTTKPNAIMKLRFRFNARWYDDPSWGRKAGWAARVGVQLDGSEVFASETIHSTNEGKTNWTVCEVLLPIAEAGEHTLAFTALDPQWEGETDSEVLLDDVKTAIAYLASGDAYANLVLDLAQGTTLDLSSSVQGYKIKNVFYNGEKIHGTISAATYPAFVTGSGKLKAGSGLVVIVR